MFTLLKILFSFLKVGQLFIRHVLTLNILLPISSLNMSVVIRTPHGSLTYCTELIFAVIRPKQSWHAYG